MIDSTNSLASPSPIDTESDGGDTQVNSDQFMKLLVTQLQNQDPLEPMDNREMIVQLSQLTGVEQLVSIQQRIGALEIATAGMANTQVADLVGKQIEADLDNLRLGTDGPVNGAFTLNGRANEVNVEIRNEAGEVVRTMQLGGQFPGAHGFEWNGLDDRGERVSAGRYSVEVTATDDGDNPLEVSTEISGRASGVSYENGFPELRVGEARVMLGDVTSISE